MQYVMETVRGTSGETSFSRKREGRTNRASKQSKQGEHSGQEAMALMTSGRRLLVLSTVLSMGRLVLPAAGLDFHGMEDNCILSFVVPRDKVKSSCDIEERVTRRLNAMETKVVLYKQHMQELQEQLQKERQLNSERLHQMEERVNRQVKPVQETDSLLQKRILSLEEEVRKLRAAPATSSSSSSFPSSSAFHKEVISNSLRDSEAIVVSGRSLDEQKALQSLVKALVHSEVKVLLDNYTQYNQVINVVPRWEVHEEGREEKGGREKTLVADDSPTLTTAAAELRADSTKNLALSDDVTTIVEQINSTRRQITEEVEIIFRNITSGPVVLETMALEKGDDYPRKSPDTGEAGSGTVPENLGEVSGVLTFTDADNGPTEHTTQTNLHVPTGEVIVKEVAHAPQARMIHSKGGKATADGLGPTAVQQGEQQKIGRSQQEESMLRDHNQLLQQNELLKTEIQRILQQKMDEILDLVAKRYAVVQSRLDDQEKRLQQLEQRMTDSVKQLDESVKGLQLEMTSTSQGIQTVFARTEGLSELQETVKDLKRNMTVEGGTRYLEALIDEHNKKVRKLERLTAVYQQSMEHYRNESKMEYRDLTERMNKEASVVKLLHQSLYDNVTSEVQQATSHLNASFKHAADDVRQRMQVMEDSNLLLQIDLSSFERQLKSKTSKLEDSFKQLEADVNDVKQKSRNLQRSMGSLESTHEQLVQATNATSKEVATLKMEVKLNVLNDWLPYNFDYAKSRTDCFGDQFVRRSTFKTGRLVGVVLCSRDRYKIFLGQSLTDTFKNIGDDVGMGEDHCQFVGATDVSKVKVSPLASSMETEQGYVRAHWGEEPRPELISFIRPSPLWYECGVSIP